MKCECCIHYKNLKICEKERITPYINPDVTNIIYCPYEEYDVSIPLYKIN